jgi:hypothetical protein
MGKSRNGKGRAVTRWRSTNLTESRAGEPATQRLIHSGDAGSKGRMDLSLPETGRQVEAALKVLSQTQESRIRHLFA